MEAPGVVFAGVALKTNASGAVASNVLLPQWRESLISLLDVILWGFVVADEVNWERERMLNKVVVPL